MNHPIPGTTFRRVASAGAIALSIGCTDSPLPTAPKLSDQASLAAAGGGNSFVKSIVGLEPLLDARINYSFGFGISDAGLVVGSSFSADQYSRAVIWDGSSFPTPIGLDGPVEGDASAITPDGSVIVGSVDPKAVRWVKLGGVWTQLELPGQLPGSSCSAADIASDGTIVGSCTYTSGETWAVVWRNGNTQGVSAGFGQAVNANQQVLVQNPNGTAAIWDLRTNPPTSTPIGSLGGSGLFALDMNDLGQVVGQAVNAAGDLRPFLWTAKKGMVDLGTLNGAEDGFANSINNAGLIVGATYQVGTTTRATLWAKGKIIDLGVLPGYNGSNAQSVNSSGQIVGYSSTFALLDHRATLWTVNVK